MLEIYQFNPLNGTYLADMFAGSFRKGLEAEELVEETEEQPSEVTPTDNTAVEPIPEAI